MQAPTASAAAAGSAYHRVKQHLMAGLAEGRWPAGQQMPSEAELVTAFGVSRMTVSRALRELQHQGLVQRRQGRGTFAAALQRVPNQLTLPDVHDEIEARGHRHTARVALQRQEAATAALAAQLGLAAGAAVFHTLITHFENGVPLQTEDRYVNPDSAPGYLQADFKRTTPTQWLFQHTALWQAQYRIEAGRASAREARLLGIDADAPCLVVVRRSSSSTAPITLARLVHPGALYALHGEFAP